MEVLVAAPYSGDTVIVDWVIHSESYLPKSSPQTSAYRKPAFQPSAFRQLFIGFQPSAEKKLIYTRVNILDLKILQVFFKNRGEILVLFFKKMLNFLSFLFYFMFQDISSKTFFFQKIFQTDGKISSPNHVVYP